MIKKKYLLILLVTGILISVIVVVNNPFYFSNIFSQYKTQTIIYVNKNNPKLTIEFQMKGIGSFGYKRRIIKRNKDLFFNQEKVIDTSKIDLFKWEKVNININELNLKGG